MKFAHVHCTLISSDWKVLQVGGSSQPFRLATHVIDSKPFEERLVTNSWLQFFPERFSKETWVVQDISTTPWPFEDKFFDYVIIDNDIVKTRDPVGVCKEAQRVGKRGYIETPDVVVEHIKDVEGSGLTGYASHRWFVDLKSDELVFIHKHPLVHLKDDFWVPNPKISNPPYVNPNLATQGLFWDTNFSVMEDVESAEFPDWTFEENTWKYKSLTDSEEKEKTFWNISEPVPVLLEESPFVPGKLVSIKNVPVKFAVPLVTKENQRHPEILNFERVMASNRA